MKHGYVKKGDLCAVCGKSSAESYIANLRAFICARCGWLRRWAD